MTRFVVPRQGTEIYFGPQPRASLRFALGFRAYNKMGKGRVARGLAMLQGARRENILYGSSTDEQRRSSGKDRQPGGLFSGGRLAALLLGHRAFWLCSLVAPCQPPARKRRAHSPFCYRLLFLQPSGCPNFEMRAGPFFLIILDRNSRVWFHKDMGKEELTKASVHDGVHSQSYNKS
jgi:hypothetical protein